MSDNYFEFTQEEFEDALYKIAEDNNLKVKDCSNQPEFQHTKERVYMVSTKNSHVGILIYSTISVYAGLARDVGEDAVRVNITCKYKDKNYYKKMKKHYRVTTFFANLRKTIESINEDSNKQQSDISRWLFAIKKNN